jgi:hypothetical protein
MIERIALGYQVLVTAYPFPLAIAQYLFLL